MRFFFSGVFFFYTLFIELFYGKSSGFTKYDHTRITYNNT